jgi:hypothetical protein
MPSCLRKPESGAVQIRRLRRQLGWNVTTRGRRRAFSYVPTRGRDRNASQRGTCIRPIRCSGPAEDTQEDRTCYVSVPGAEDSKDVRK